MPSSIIRVTVFPPAPPQPTTVIFVSRSLTTLASSSSDIVPDVDMSCDGVDVVSSTVPPAASSPSCSASSIASSIIESII